MEKRTGRDDLFAQLNDYCERLSSPTDHLLYQLERETHLKTLAPQMMSGRLQGQFLRLLSQWMRPKCILEIGAFTGYGTLCLAEGLAEGGALHALEANPEIEYILRKYVQASPWSAQIQVHIGDARALIPELPGSFDLVFIDAAKPDYPHYYELIIDRVNPGGCILADNVLWSGKVVQEHHDEDTAAMHAFNRMVQADPRVDNLILPVRDGILLARKI